MNLREKLARELVRVARLQGRLDHCREDYADPEADAALDRACKAISSGDSLEQLDAVAELVRFKP